MPLAAIRYSRALFVWSALTGIRLWRGDPRGWKWAIILFAAQIPVLTVPGLSYEYYTGVGDETADPQRQSPDAMKGAQ